MRLYEHETKELLKKYGIHVPSGKIVASVSELTPSDAKGVVKPLILQGKKGKANSIFLCNSKGEVQSAVSFLLGSSVRDEKVDRVLFEQKIDIMSEYYLSITYDTETRTPVILFSKYGGVYVEDLVSKHASSLVKHAVRPLFGLEKHEAQQIVEQAGFSGDLKQRIAEVILKLYICFEVEDARVAEINPLALTRDNHLVAVGALMDLDDDAGYKHKDRTYAQRQAGVNRQPTEREILVKQKNDEDYRGTIKYVELEGDIGFMAAGGGGSITCMDALLTEGGKPSNYTEFSGNPSADKVYTLTKVILTKPGLKALWIVGAIANFTRVDVTMEGIVKALEELKPTVPIVVRRSGPFEKEGLALLTNIAKKHGLDVEVHGAEMPMAATANLVVKKAYGTK